MQQSVAPSRPLSIDRSVLASWLPFCEIALILAVFFIQAGWPVPDVNEPHYLSKAKHYWNPNWCGHDFFCNAADAHQVFYWTFGWLTRYLSLPAVAWCGQALTWTLIATGWYRLSTALVAGPLYSVLSAALFVTLNDRFQMAGEWVVGGIEAKGFAYALVFFGMATMVRGQWTKTWLLLGAATAFHVLVGGWSIVAAGLVWLISGADRPPIVRTLLSLIAALVLALPGLLPALWLTWHADPLTVAAANQIYVFERLDHHLVFTSFPPLSIARFGLLLVLWGVLCYVGPRGPAQRRMQWFVVGSLAIAAVGIVISLGLRQHEALAAKLLRFYWFRLSDVMLPAGAALAAVSFIATGRRLVPTWGAGWLLLCIVGIGVHLGDVLQTRLTYSSPRSDWTLDDPEAWWAICDWVSENTPEDAVFITPRMAATFRWYTNRAEVVNRKDVPQDAAGLVAWNQRMEDLYLRPAEGETPAEWRNTIATSNAAKLAELGDKYGATYLITSAYPRLPLKKVSPPNQGYAVYRLPQRVPTIPPAIAPLNGR